MAFPVGWPARLSSGSRSIRFFVQGTTTANWSDNAYLFVDDAGANTYTPTPFIKPGSSTIVSIGSPMGGGIAVGIPPGEPAGPKPYIWSGTLRVCNDGGNALEFSFTAINDAADTTVVHGALRANEIAYYRNRFEGGIALRIPAGGTATPFRVEAW